MGGFSFDILDKFSGCFASDGDKGPGKKDGNGKNKKQSGGNSGLKNGSVDFDKMNNNNGDASKVQKRADGDTQDVPGGSQSSDPAGQSGDEVYVNETITVRSGEVFDGQGKTYVAGSALGDGGQSEGQQPVFKIEDGGTLQNVNLIGENGGAADGVHTYGDATIDNVHWLDVGEDALTKKEPGDVVLSNSSMANGDDKGIQDNAGGSLKVINSQFENLGKAYRQNGGTDFAASVEFINCTFDNIKDPIAQSDSPNFVGRITDSELGNVGEVFSAPDSADTSIE